MGERGSMHGRTTCILDHHLYKRREGYIQMLEYSHSYFHSSFANMYILLKIKLQLLNNMKHLKNIERGSLVS